tara:strand:- start:1358 stop:1621 length:264 start_codon:yes stop_codon:yes gene_type:complete
MNKLIATKTKPVTQNVRLIVSSIELQFDANGVNVQGLTKWNTTEPKTKRIKTIAIDILDESLIYFIKNHNHDFTYSLVRNFFFSQFK